MPRFVRLSCALVAGGALAAGTLAGCGQSHGSSTGTVEVQGAFIPAPPSPDVAAAYLVLHETGDKADRLLSASSPDASMTMPMTESGGPSGDAMAALPAVAVPAHGTFRFTPGHDHLMLEGLNRKLAVGDHVPVTLVFARAGKVTVSVPVVDLDRILGSS